MEKAIAVAALLGISSSAFAEWNDVNYSASLPADAVYCDGLGSFEEFTSFVQDGDNAGAMRMIASGDCAMTSKAMNVQVFQEESVQEFVTFLSPSGKAFYTLKGYLK